MSKGDSNSNRHDKRVRRNWRKTQTGKTREIQLVLDADEAVARIRDSLTDFATEVGTLYRPKLRVYSKGNVSGACSRQTRGVCDMLFWGGR